MIEKGTGRGAKLKAARRQQDRHDRQPRRVLVSATPRSSRRRCGSARRTASPACATSAWPASTTRRVRWAPSLRPSGRRSWTTPPRWASCARSTTLQPGDPRGRLRQRAERERPERRRGQAGPQGGRFRGRRRRAHLQQPVRGHGCLRRSLGSGSAGHHDRSGTPRRVRPEAQETPKPKPKTPDKPKTTTTPPKPKVTPSSPGGCAGPSPTPGEAPCCRRRSSGAPAGRRAAARGAVPVPRASEPAEGGLHRRGIRPPSARPATSAWAAFMTWPICGMPVAPVSVTACATSASSSASSS